MTPDDLATAGRALYGERWQTPLARDLNVSDRTIRRWFAGDFPIPAGIEKRLRVVLREHLAAIGGLAPYIPKESDNTICHSGKYVVWRYDEVGNLALLSPGLAKADELPLLAEGAKEALRRELGRDPRVRASWADPRSGRVPATAGLHGFMRGSVVVPPGVDLTAPAIDEPFDAEAGTLP